MKERHFQGKQTCTQLCISDLFIIYSIGQPTDETEWIFEKLTGGEGITDKHPIASALVGYLFLFTKDKQEENQGRGDSPLASVPPLLQQTNMAVVIEKQESNQCRSILLYHFHLACIATSAKQHGTNMLHPACWIMYWAALRKVGKTPPDLSFIFTSIFLFRWSLLRMEYVRIYFACFV